MSGDRLLLDLQSLSTQFSKAAFESGLSLYRSQQVLDCAIGRVNTREWSLAGNVRSGGKGREQYDVSAVLEVAPQGDITFFSASCNCGAGRNCRHSAALAVKAAYQSGQVKATTPEPPAHVAPGASRHNSYPTGPSLDLFGEPTSTPPTPLPAALPAAETANTQQGIKPVAHLHISAVPDALVTQRGLLCATLRFAYGDVFHYALNDHNPVRIDSLTGDGPHEPVQYLYRDLATEHAVHHSLHLLGLAGDARGQFIRPFISGAQQQCWLQWLDEGFAPLRAAGFEITVAAELDGWIACADGLQARMEADTGDLADIGGGNGEKQTDWFSLSLGININGERRNILPLLPELLAQLTAISDGNAGKLPPSRSTLQLPPYIYLRQADGSYWRLPCEPLRPWLQALLDLVSVRGTSPDGAFNDKTIRLSRLEALRLGTALQPEHADGMDAGTAAVWQGAEDLNLVISQLAGRSRLPEITAPAGLRAQLRPYQLHGLQWLQFLRASRLGGILADDMGLGKTLQTLAHILVEKEAGRLDRPVLIIAPLSLMGNWRREAARFTPDLRVSVIHGHKRHRAAARMGGSDIVIVPYSLLQRDQVHWQQQAWHMVVLDEAQHIKNASSQAARVVGELTTRHRLCLSGTPMENHLGEVWSLFNFLMPDFLGNAARFKALYRTPIEKQGDNERLGLLRRRVAPFMLRRTKHEVARDLPALQEAIASVEFGDGQADLYETIRLSTEKTVRDALANKGLGQSQLQILDALVRLRQVCCDPRLLPAHSPGSMKAGSEAPASAKLDWLMETLPQMLAEGRRVLVFSQFTSMLALIEEALAERGIEWVKLTGQSQDRDALIERFTSGQVPLFLISLKAGGTGLNLQQADTVIHYDPWWNPAVQEQATARAHRIGQTQAVLVYRLVAQGTIEERILALQERKAALAQGLYTDTANRGAAMFSESDLAALLEPMGNALSPGAVLPLITPEVLKATSGSGYDYSDDPRPAA